MSNCSDGNSEDALDTAALVEGIPRLLAAIADEIARAASEVVKLGELMSGDAVKVERSASTHDLQAFDIFAQTAYAQARLLKRLARGDDRQPEVGVAALIEEVPFAGMRQRLHAAAHGQRSELLHIEEPDDTDVSWF